MSPNKNYESGRRLEYDSMARWRAKGYTVSRSAGSHGVWDVCAARFDAPVELIQCKSTKDEAVGIRLLRQFKLQPPLTPSKFYHQVLEVKIKGSTKILSITI